MRPGRHALVNVLATGAALAALLAGAGALGAQAVGSIRGRVLEAGSLRPLSGAQIVIPGTGRGTLADAAGQFTLGGVPAGTHTVRAQMIGYRDQDRQVTVSAGQTATLEFEMAQTAISLNEIVVTGTAGAVSKRTLGNAITKVNAEEVVSKASIGNVAELLTARTPGLTLLANAGTPGAAGDIRIRGAGSFIGNRPVVFIDGIRVSTDSLGSFSPSGAGTTSFSAQTTSALDLINPNDIESVEVIKGPAAATLYGADAAGGVIQIITKKGNRGGQPLRFDVRTEYGASSWELPIPDNYTLCSAPIIAQRDAAGPVYPGCQGLQPGSVLVDNPLVRDPAALRTGALTRLSIAARGGSDRFSYYVAAASDEEEGVFFNSVNEKRSVRANFTAAPGDRIDFQITSSYLQGDLQLPVGDEAAQGMLLSAFRGRPGRVPPAGDSTRAGWATTNARQANSYDNTTKTDRFTVGATVNARPLDFFRNRLTIGLDYTSGLAQVISPPGSTDAEFAGTPEGFVAQRYPRSFNYTVDYAGNLDFDLRPGIRSTTSFGVQAISRRNDQLFASGRGFGSPDVTLIGTAQTTAGSNSYSQWRTLGLFAQEQIGFNDRLYVTGALRMDNSSVFGADIKRIFYPKVSLAWILSDEPGLRSLFAGGRFDSFKLRAAYGHAGKAPDPFSASQTYTVDKVIVGDSVRSALRARAYGNPALKAERGEEYEVGFEAGLLDERVGVEFTYYNKRMRDVIISSGVGGSTGFGSTFYGATQSQLKNLGETLNTGIELSLAATPVQRRAIVWESRLNLATNANKLVSFGDARTSETPFAPYGNVQQHRPGYPLAGYWAALPRRNADGTPVLNPANNAPILDTARYIGPSAPTREVGFANTVTLFRNVRLFALFDYKGGHHLFNYKEYNRCFSNRNCERLTDPANVDPATGDIWPVGAAANKNPEARVWASNVPGAWIDKADFVKLRDVSVSYSVPTAWAQRFRASAATLTLAARNLAQWTDYGGIDPETNSYGNRSFVRADVYPVPMIRRLTMSLNLSF